MAYITDSEFLRQSAESLATLQRIQKRQGDKKLMSDSVYPSAFGPMSSINIGGQTLPFFRSVNWAKEEKIEEEAGKEEAAIVEETLQADK